MGKGVLLLLGLISEIRVPIHSGDGLVGADVNTCCSVFVQFLYKSIHFIQLFIIGNIFYIYIFIYKHVIVSD